MRPLRDPARWYPRPGAPDELPNGRVIVAGVHIDQPRAVLLRVPFGRGEVMIGQQIIAVTLLAIGVVALAVGHGAIGIGHQANAAQMFTKWVQSTIPMQIA